MLALIEVKLPNTLGLMQRSQKQGAVLCAGVHSMAQASFCPSALAQKGNIAFLKM